MSAPTLPANRGPVILALGIVSCALLLVSAGFASVLALPIGIAAWAMGRRDCRNIAAGTVSATGAGMVQGGYVCGIIGTGLSSLSVLACIGYGCFMLGAMTFFSGRPIEERMREAAQQRQMEGAAKDLKAINDQLKAQK